MAHRMKTRLDDKPSTARYRRSEHYDSETTDAIAHHVSGILEAVGEDPRREGLLKTPQRVAHAYQFLLQGYQVDAHTILRSAIFEETYHEMILVRDIDVYSLCEHHLLPFFGKAHIAYIPNGKIVGLSKLPRVVDAYARRLQMQERLTVEIRDAIHSTLQPQGVAVVIEANHLCMVMRGVQKQNAITATSAMSGEFLHSHRTRAEFMRLINSGGAS